MALLTCLRLGLDVTLGSQNWLIQPFEKESEGQRVLFYRIYESVRPAGGSFVRLIATDKIRDHIRNLGDFFLAFCDIDPLWTKERGGIFPRKSKEYMGRIFNKGVFIKEVPALFDYAVAMEKLNRDRDLIDMNELAEHVWDLIRDTDHEEIIKALIVSAVMQEEQWRPLVEFQSYLYTYHPEKWKGAFHSLFSEKAVLSTNDLASMEAQILGYQPVKLQSQVHRLLKDAGVTQDTDKLREDYKIKWVNPGELSRQEKDVMNQAKECAAAVGWQFEGEFRVFSQYHDSEEVTGLYLREVNAIGIKRTQLEKGLAATLGTLLHELAHHYSGADDYSREFAAEINAKLTDTLMQLVDVSGIPVNVELDGFDLILPSDISLSAADLNCHVIITGPELIIRTSQHQIGIPMAVEIEPALLKRKIKVGPKGFYVRLADDLIQNLKRQTNSEMTICCHINR